MNTCTQGLPDPEWDDRQQHRGGHMLQGRPWGQFQEALGKEVVWAEGDGWSWLGLVTVGRGVRYLYLPYGPTVRSAASLERALTSIKAAGRELKVDFVRLEPLGVPEVAVAKSGLKPVPMVQPPHTRVIDLTLTEEELRKGVSSGHRNAINGAERRELVIKLERDEAGIGPMLDLIHETAAGRGFRPQADHYYRTMLRVLMPLGVATLGTVRHNGNLVAGAIFLDYQGTRAYAHAGARPEARTLQAAVPLVWQAGLAAKADGLRRFDLWGTVPEDAPESHPWAGFTRFKQAFGGTEMAYNGTWEYPLKPLKYALIQSVKRLRG